MNALCGGKSRGFPLFMKSCNKAIEALKEVAESESYSESVTDHLSVEFLSEKLTEEVQIFFQIVEVVA
jgi:hypothetical protein